MDELDTTHELEVRLALLAAVDDWGRLRVRGTKPRLETAGWVWQMMGRVIRGESREDTVACLATTVRAVEEAVRTDSEEAKRMRQACTGASAGVHRLCATTYADDARTASALRLHAERLSRIARGGGSDDTFQSDFGRLHDTRSPPTTPPDSPTSAALVHSPKEGEKEEQQ